MAKKKETPPDLDLDAAGKAGGGKKMIILYVVIGILVLAVAGLGTLFVMRQGGEGGGEAAVHKSEEAYYIPLDSLTVNFNAKGPARFLQVDMQAMAHSEEVGHLLEMHKPAIRNDLLLLLASQSFDVVSTPEGKEALRQQAVETINRVLSEQAKSPERIETVYFTSFVMQ